MSKSAVFDTNVIVHLILKERKSNKILTKIKSLNGDLYLPGPVISELIYILPLNGYSGSTKDILFTLKLMDFLIAPALISDQIRAGELVLKSKSIPNPYSASGKSAPLSLADGLVLAISERLDAPVITGDRYWKTFMIAGGTKAQVEIL